MNKKDKIIERLKKDKKTLKEIIDDTLWMAIRYAHGRHTYAPSIIRSSVKTLKKLYPKFKLRRDIMIESPSKEELTGGFVLREDWLDDLFE